MLWCCLSSLPLPDSWANLSWPWLLGNSSSMEIEHSYRGAGWISTPGFSRVPQRWMVIASQFLGLTWSPSKLLQILYWVTQDCFSKDVKNLLVLWCWQYFSSGLRCFRSTWICVPFLRAVPVPSSLSSSSGVCKPLCCKDLSPPALLKAAFPLKFSLLSCLWFQELWDFLSLPSGSVLIFFSLDLPDHLTEELLPALGLKRQHWLISLYFALLCVFVFVPLSTVGFPFLLLTNKSKAYRGITQEFVQFPLLW